MQGCYQQFYSWFFSSHYSFYLLQPWAGLLFFSDKLSLIYLLPRLFMFEKLLHLLVLIFTSSLIPIGLSSPFSHWVEFQLYHLQLFFNFFQLCAVSFFWCTIGLQIEISLGSSHFLKFP